MKYISIFIMLLVIACSGTGEQPNIFDSDTETEDDIDECDYITCNNPPDDYCTEDGNLIEYTGEATCIDGDCNYSYEVIECEWGCMIDEEGDECGPDPCVNYICDNPPDNYCVEYPDYDIAYNYQQEGECYLDDNNQPICQYFTNSDFCILTSEGLEVCEVINGIAQCVIEQE